MASTGGDDRGGGASGSGPSGQDGTSGQDGNETIAGAGGDRSGGGAEGGDGGLADAGAGGGDGGQAAASRDGSGAGGEPGSDIGDAFGGGDSDQVTAGASQEEDEFNRALDEFDELMSQEQETLARTGGTSAADEALSQAAGADGSTVAGLPETGGFGEGEETGGALPASAPSASPTRASRAPDIPDEPPATVEGCEDDDRVARQLCEAATEENDPFLRAALWDEYNEYLKIIARE